MNDHLYFIGGVEHRVYRTDGTGEGTVEVTIGDSESLWANSHLIKVGNTIFFEAASGSHPDGGLWKTDGTEEGSGFVRTSVLKRSFSDGSFLVPVGLGDKLILTGHDDFHGYELWSSDGTAEGTSMIKEINTQGNGNVSNVFATPGFTYFFADDGLHGRELWKSDGTAAGTSMIREIFPGQTFSVGQIALLGDKLMFIADDGVHGLELWTSDGTTTGTNILTDLSGGGTSTFFAGDFTVVENTMYFNHINENGSTTIWRTDGTQEGTQPFYEFPCCNGIDIRGATGSAVFYHAYNADLGKIELWKTDGTMTGTMRVVDAEGNALYSPQELIALNDNTVIVLAENGDQDFELWASDGSGTGTFKLTAMDHDLTPNNTRLSFRGNIIDGVLYFMTTEGASNFSLWQSDGTPGGTKLIQRLEHATAVFDMAGVGNNLYFVTSSGRLWKSDLTEAGTVVLQEGFNSTLFDDPEIYLVVGNGDDLYVLVNNDPFSLNRIEVWALTDEGLCRSALFEGLRIQQPPVFSAGTMLFAGRGAINGGIELYRYVEPSSTSCISDQQIVFGVVPVDKNIYSAPFEIDVSATSGLPLTITSSHPEVAEVSGKTITIHGAGETSITAFQEGNELWYPALPVTVSLSVSATVSVETEISHGTATHPNPFTDQFTLHVKSAKQETVDVTVINGAGMMVNRVDYLQTNTDHTLGGDWRPGMYLLKIRTHDQIIVKKLVKH